MARFSKHPQHYLRWAVVLVVAVLVLGFGSARLVGIRVLRAAPEVFADERAFGPLIQRSVHGELVSYEALRASAGELHAYVAWLEQNGPRLTPRKFRSREARLSYYLNAYNALVLFAVVQNWPISSVRDVRGWIEPKAGFGFFWAQHFVLDGEYINLYDLENDVIRRFDDARVHAAINCASESCPRLSEVVFDERNVDRQLETLTRAFVAREEHVRIERDTLYLSAIFDWYRDDFEAHALSLGVAGSLLGWIRHYRTQSDVPEDVRLEFLPYDWGLNEARAKEIAR